MTYIRATFKDYQPRMVPDRIVTPGRGVALKSSPDISGHVVAFRMGRATGLVPVAVLGFDSVEAWEASR